jgi:hypothetical protein
VAAISLSDTFAASTDAAGVRERVLSWFAQLPHSVVSDGPERIEIKTGSQAKMRLLGGALIAASSLPIRTVVTLEPSSGGTWVTVTASDAVGFGVKTGMKGKYERRVAEVVTALRAAVS